MAQEKGRDISFLRHARFIAAEENPFKLSFTEIFRVLTPSVNGQKHAGET